MTYAVPALLLRSWFGFPFPERFARGVCLIAACAFVTYERWAQAEAALEAMNGSTQLDTNKGMSVKFADAKVASDMGAGGQKRGFGMEGQGQFGGPNKRAFTGAMPGMPQGFNPYGMGYDMSAMMGMGYSGGMMGMPGGMPGMVSAW